MEGEGKTERTSVKKGKRKKESSAKGEKKEKKTTKKSKKSKKAAASGDDTISEKKTEKAQRAALAMLRGLGLPVSLTGARPGDTLFGIEKGTEGAKMTLSDISGPIPPRRKVVDQILQFPDIADEFLLTLDTIDFFHNLVRDEKNTKSRGTFGSYGTSAASQVCHITKGVCFCV